MNLTPWFEPSAVSIHALVKSATAMNFNPPSIQQVSIHALVKSATVKLVPEMLLNYSFNPRAREERDNEFVVQRTVKYVSIHALVKSATSM